MFWLKTSTRGRVFWQDVAAAVAARGKANAAIRLQIEDLHKIMTDAHQSVVEAILPQLPEARPRQHLFSSHCMRLIDRRNEALQREASEDEIVLIAREIKRAGRNAKNEFLRASVTKNELDSQAQKISHPASAHKE